MAEQRQGPVSPDDYVMTAFDILEQKGHSGITLGELCSRLGVSTGSFYHHFDGMDGFVDVFVTRWESDQEVAMKAAASENSELRRILVAKELAAMFRHKAEAAIRAWSQSNPRVLEAQQRVDRMRRDNLAGLARRAGVDEHEADLLAAVGMAILVGMQQLQDTDRHMIEALNLYQQLIMRAAAGGTELPQNAGPGGSLPSAQ
ncbi:MAG: TetR/AcrR family transcriptional regulator [Actinomycetes bacterium]